MLTSEEREAFNNQVDKVLEEVGGDLIEVNRKEKERAVKALLTVENGGFKPIIELVILPRHRFRVRSKNTRETFYRRDDVVELIEDIIT